MPSTEVQLEAIRATAAARTASSAAVLRSLDALTADATREAREVPSLLPSSCFGCSEPFPVCS